MKMKTLKDLGNEFEDTGRTYIEDIELRAEAVKWAINTYWHTDEVLDFIMQFFNLTEEDLK